MSFCSLALLEPVACCKGQPLNLTKCGPTMIVTPSTFRVSAWSDFSGSCMWLARQLEEVIRAQKEADHSHDRYFNESPPPARLAWQSWWEERGCNPGATRVFSLNTAPPPHPLRVASHSAPKRPPCAVQTLALGELGPLSHFSPGISCVLGTVRLWRGSKHSCGARSSRGCLFC